ncbi:MAG: hypothetical protein RR365_13460 [Bacteroides sp.]
MGIGKINEMAFASNPDGSCRGYLSDGTNKMYFPNIRFTCSIEIASDDCTSSASVAIDGTVLQGRSDEAMYTIAKVNALKSDNQLDLEWENLINEMNI